MFVYQSFKPGLWTVGFYRPDGEWVPVSGFTDEGLAQERVHYLNGGAA